MANAVNGFVEARDRINKLPVRLPRGDLNHKLKNDGLASGESQD